MGTKALSGRENWQEAGGGKADAAEKKFYEIMTSAFKGTEFRIRSKPREFKHIYEKISLTPQVIEAIYNPVGETWTHGITPDYAIDNVETNKTLYIEVKRQDGWVENKPRKAGRGNAHERSCKYFTPGLLKTLRSKGGLGDDVIPFWIVLQGDIARDPKRVREIYCWFEGIEDHFFLWSDGADNKAVVKHFNEKLKKLLL